MENFHLNLSGVDRASGARRKRLIIWGPLFVLVVLSLLYDYPDNSKRVKHILFPFLILIDGLLFLLLIYEGRFKSYVSISDSLIKFKLWGLGRTTQLEWLNISNVLISKSKITFVQHDNSKVNLKLNVLSTKRGNEIIHSVKGFLKDKQLDYKMIK